MEEVLNSLKQEARRLHITTIPVAHELYLLLPKAKKVRSDRKMRVAMAATDRDSHHSSGGVYEVLGNIRDGTVRGMPDTARDSLFPNYLATALRALVEESRNGNCTDPYWNEIRDSYAIAPWPFRPIRVEFSREDGLGEFRRYKYDETVGSLNDSQTIEATNRIIEDLVGEKVFFFPIRNHPESVAYYGAQRAQPEMVFNFDVREVEERGPGNITYGKVIGGINAWRFDSFRKQDATEVKNFLNTHTFNLN